MNIETNYFRKRQEGNGRFLTLILFFILLFALLVTTQPAAFNSSPVASYIIQAEEIETAVVKVEQVGGHIIHELGIINAVAADLTAAQYAELADQAGLSLHINAQVQNASYNYLPAQSTITTYHSSDVPKSISSSGTPTISSIINVPDSGTIATVKVLNLQGSHTYVSDLDFNLISPQGTEVQILNLDSCGSQDNFNIHLDDGAASANFPCPPTDGGTYHPSGPYQPSYAFSTFAGEDGQGTWTLRVNDNYNNDGGSLDSWSLEIGVLGTAPPPAPPPAPPASPSVNNTYHSSDVSKHISSSGTPSISSIINVPDSGIIANVKVLNLQGVHTYVGDLDFNLISPQGTEVKILDLVGTCSSQDNFDIHLDDAVGSSNFPCPPIDGSTYRPSFALSTFTGEDSQGTWTLRVDDNYGADGGSLDSWSLEISLLDSTSPPPSGGSPYATHTVRDEFNTGAWNNSDADQGWITDWWYFMKYGFEEEGHVFFEDGVARIDTNQYGVMRKLYMADAITATLSFDYQRHLVSDNFRAKATFDINNTVHIIGDGGTDATGSDSTTQHVTIDLTPFLDSNDFMRESGYIQIYAYQGLDNQGSSFSIDNVEVTYTSYRPDTDFVAQVDAHQVHDQSITGQGVGVAILDTGFMGRAALMHDFEKYMTCSGMDCRDYHCDSCVLRVPVVNDIIWGGIVDEPEDLKRYPDYSGHGSHIAGIIGNSLVNNENGQRNGIAPLVNIIPVITFNADGSGSYADLIAGIDWIVANKDTYNIRVINASFNAPPNSYYWEDPLNQAIMKAWQAGIVVVASAGNINPADMTPMTIGVPGNIPYIITVGGMSDGYTPSDTTDDYVMSFSAQGPTLEQFVKPDVIAPGGHIRSYMSEDSHLATNHSQFYDEGNYFTMSGTSQSAAVVSGIVALMLEADPSLTPDDVKCRLMSTARLAFDNNGDLKASIYQQGAGLVDANAAVNSSETGCANQGMNIAADIAGTTHYMGPVRWDNGNQEFFVEDANGAPTNGTAWNGGGVPWGSGGVTWGSGGTPWGSGGVPWGSGGVPWGSGGVPWGSGGITWGSGGTPWGSGGVPWGSGGVTWSSGGITWGSSGVTWSSTTTLNSSINSVNWMGQE
ncbi:MAG: S8 family serine peptidase [Chloroflexi bacterium]|nr:S8 family serine peptidase [Chloroflexota bacterium]